MMIERVHRRSSRRTQHGARRSNASNKTPRFSRARRSLFHGASRVVEWRSIGRIESNREEVSIHPVLSDS
tara:strand:- start:96 stop:305 length:210 start_codon:yes stop_codon:yes gene_type:complete